MFVFVFAQVIFLLSRGLLTSSTPALKKSVEAASQSVKSTNSEFMSLIYVKHSNERSWSQCRWRRATRWSNTMLPFWKEVSFIVIVFSVLVIICLLLFLAQSPDDESRMPRKQVTLSNWVIMFLTICRIIFSASSPPPNELNLDSSHSSVAKKHVVSRSWSCVIDKHRCT